MSEMELQFIDDEITAWGGLAILKRMMDSSHFLDHLRTLPLPAQGSNRGYPPVQLITQFIASLWCGVNRYAHLDISRFDTTIQKLFGWERMPEHKAFQRYFDKFSTADNQRVFSSLYQWFFSNLNFDNFTIDIDSSVITRHGKQQAATKGYNPRKPGRKSHHPLIAFVADVEMVANFWLRPGNSHTANNFQSFLEDTLANFPGKKIGLLRLDSGFFSNETLSYIENREQKTSYVVAVPMHYPIQRKIAEIRNWLKVENGIEISEFLHQADSWESPRRMITVRQKIATRPEAVGKQLSLFDDDFEISGYRYTCYVTNMAISPVEIWRLYRGRANCENRIKELKYDYGLDKMNQQSFDGTETSLCFMAVAYNFMSLFRQTVVCDKVRSRLSTIRYKILAIPARIGNSKDKLVIKMALQMKRRKWIQRLWDNSGASSA